jgi:hypothetical protein
MNYNRDVEAFPVLRRIIEKITGEHLFYKSPTDMGINRAKFGIIDDDAVREAAIQEIIRRRPAKVRGEFNERSGFFYQTPLRQVNSYRLKTIVLGVKDARIQGFEWKAFNHVLRTHAHLNLFWTKIEVKSTEPVPGLHF